MDRPIWKSVVIHWYLVKICALWVGRGQWDRLIWKADMIDLDLVEIYAF